MPSKPPKPKRPSGAPGASQAQIATHLDISQPRVAQFVGEGVFKPLPSRKLDLDACRIAYIRWLRDETRKSSQSAAAARVQDARAKAIELRTAREEGQLWDAEATKAAIEDILGTYRSELEGVAPGSTRDLAIRTAIQQQIDDAMDRCRARFARAERALSNGRDPFDGD
ncbi:hypothetical protein IVA96_15695 [Bradyrhizobium sp. 159]|uniref:hypothetical protein n=1 Tax=unclassified Bradyrhizobium TaxID=2631580 RepID=UPI001FF939CC|nr:MULTISPECIES: hypothetical protein [unclassified Bradyrhizobium]MCK1424602.1 hypothetical protein [Bradyrhizobium sp. CW12]MCK1618062.1 hypothetical protein [Bradyrhizobium sp. 159]MCK1646465.1 hypothetical protein [Bradyrhizobium sp. 154]MCK1758760.1 hypothetical protein [Bradyrhizobium sp. 137]